MKNQENNIEIFIETKKKECYNLKELNKVAMKRRSTYRRQYREKMVGENLSESSMEAVLELRSERLGKNNIQAKS